MQVESLEISPSEVKAEYELLRKGIKEGYVSKSSKIVRDLLAIYKHLEHKGQIIELYGAFKKAGLTENGNPRIAIVRADSAFCHLFKKKNGGAIFSRERLNTVERDWSNRAIFKEGDLELPAQTYAWPLKENRLTERYFKTVSPMIPPRIAVAISAKIVPYHYHVLFEAEYWSRDPEPPSAPRDPILGRLITPNMFAVYASWDLTELEMSLLKGKFK